MPYYQEFYLNDVSNQTRVLNGSTTFTYPVVWDDCLIMSRRANARQKAIWTKELSDVAVDPYAYFLEKYSETKYNALLAERGAAYQGEPDRGNAFEMSRYNLHSTMKGKTVIRVESTNGYNRNTDVQTNPIFVPSSAELGLTGQLPPLRRFDLTDRTSLATFAQQAYARTAPTSRVFDAAQFLGELREGLPSIPIATFTSGLRILKGAGSDFLNVEFGWKPLVNDIINIGKALAGATDMLSGNGERVHRKFTMPTQRTSYERSSDNSVVSLSANYGAFSRPEVPFDVYSKYGLGGWGNGSGPRGGYYFLRTNEQTRWFEGEFTNFFRLGFDPSSYIERLDQLVNTRLTPSILWELAPWSWLVDWHLRIGDTIRANELAANDLLVMHYGYAMEHTLQKDLVSVRFRDLDAPLPNNQPYVYWTGLPDSATYIATSETKRRIRANPYGFRTGGTGSLSQGQLQILGALGLTRLK